MFFIKKMTKYFFANISKSSNHFHGVLPCLADVYYKKPSSSSAVWVRFLIFEKKLKKNWNLTNFWIFIIPKVLCWQGWNFYHNLHGLKTDSIPKIIVIAQIFKNLCTFKKKRFSDITLEKIGLQSPAKNQIDCLSLLSHIL